jgi:uncharacterized DUF497 family protein
VEYDWDRRKRAANLAKHGLDLADAPIVFRGAVVEVPDDRRDYRERRIIAIGRLGGRLVTCVYTDRTKPEGREVRRVISLRPASRRERARYGDHTGAST